jgi:outer membrane protein TolC
MKIFKLIILVMAILTTVCLSAYCRDETCPEIKKLESPELVPKIEGEIKIDKDIQEILDRIEKELKQAVTYSSIAKSFEESKFDTEKEIQLTFDYELIPIDLEEALQTALAQNYDIKIITTQKDRDKWLYYNELAGFLPDVYYNFQISKLDGEFLVGQIIPLETSEVTINSNLNYQWKIFTGFRRYFDAVAARNVYKANKENVDFTKDETLLRTASGYYRLLQDKLNLEVLDRNLEQRKAQLQINTDRFNAGVGTKFDVLRAEAEVANSTQNLVIAYNRFRLSQAELANILGINIFAPIYPSENDIKPLQLVDEKVPLEILSNVALTNRPDLTAANFDVTAAKARKKSEYSLYIPQVSLYGQVSDQGTLSIGVSRNYALRLEVDWRGGNGLGLDAYTAIKARNEQLKEAELKATITARNINEKILSSYYDSIAAKARIEAAGEEVESANESLRLAFIRLESGVGIFVDVLQAQATAVEAKIRLINATVLYNIAQAQMLFDMGIISANNLLNGIVLEETGKK